MSTDALKNRLPDYARDLKLNLSSLLADESLNPQQWAGTFLVSAVVSRNPLVIAGIADAVSGDLSPEADCAARAAAHCLRGSCRFSPARWRSRAGNRR